MESKLGLDVLFFIWMFLFGKLRKQASSHEFFQGRLAAIFGKTKTSFETPLNRNFYEKHLNYYYFTNLKIK